MLPQQYLGASFLEVTMVTLVSCLNQAKRENQPFWGHPFSFGPSRVRGWQVSAPSSQRCGFTRRLRSTTCPGARLRTFGSHARAPHAPRAPRAPRSPRPEGGAPGRWMHGAGCDGQRAEGQAAGHSGPLHTLQLALFMACREGCISRPWARLLDVSRALQLVQKDTVALKNHGVT